MSDNQTKSEVNDYEIKSPLENDTTEKSSTCTTSMDDDGSIENNWTEVVEQFDQMNLRESLLRGIYGYGFERPSDIQQRAIKPCISGRDVIVQSKSGTGKTATFIIAVLQQLDIDFKDCQALILVPTRELACGIQRMVLTIGEYMNVTCHACIGGTKVHDDIKCFETGVQVAVGTPGRVCDMLKRSALCSKNIKMLVLDEADEMLSRGFREQIFNIITMMPNNIQIILLSATMPTDILELTNTFMNNPIKIIFKYVERTLEGIRQFYVNVDREEWKLETLYDLYETLKISQAIVFCNSRRRVDWLTETLRARDISASSLYADMDKEQRDISIKDFRTGSCRILIGTDFIGSSNETQRGNVDINYDLPTNPASYIHRIGRRGAFGRKGLAINLITNDDQQKLRHIEQFYNTHIEELPVDIADLI